MTTYDPTEVEGTDLEPRTERALSECMTVLPEASDLFTVIGENQNGEYTVDLRAPACSCKDFEYRAGKDFDPDDGCKHIRRARFATGEQPIPDSAEVDPFLGTHTDETARVAATDGGIIEAGDEGEVLEESDERPDDCDCGDWNQGADLPCWPCYRDGFEEPAGE